MVRKVSYIRDTTRTYGAVPGQGRDRLLVFVLNEDVVDLAIATSVSSSLVCGVIAFDYGDKVDVITDGHAEVLVDPSTVNSLVPGCDLFLSDLLPGHVSPIAPSQEGRVVVSVGEMVKRIESNIVLMNLTIGIPIVL